jgi:hypothetical protein
MPDTDYLMLVPDYVSTIPGAISGPLIHHMTHLPLDPQPPPSQFAQVISALFGVF